MLAAVACLVHGGLPELLQRVPFDDAALETQFDLPRGSMARVRVSASIAREPAARLAAYLSLYLVEERAESDFTDVCVMQNEAGSYYLYVGCPSCGTTYRVGRADSTRLLIIDPGRQEVTTGMRLALAYSWDKRVRCPGATMATGCTALIEVWHPRRIRCWPTMDAVDSRVSKHTTSPLVRP